MNNSKALFFLEIKMLGGVIMMLYICERKNWCAKPCSLTLIHKSYDQLYVRK